MTANGIFTKAIRGLRDAAKSGDAEAIKQAKKAVFYAQSNKYDPIGQLAKINRIAAKAS